MIDDDGFDVSACVMSFNSPHRPVGAGLLCAQVLHYILPWAVQALAPNVHMSGHTGSPANLCFINK